MYETVTTEKFHILQTKKDLLVLGIESSCDETAAAVVRNGREVLSDQVHSQIDIHAAFGGVVPEVASRNHIQNIDKVVDAALKQAGIAVSALDAIAVTYGAGLMGSLLVGISFAKGLSFANELPLIAVNHIQAHIAAGYLADADLRPPFLALIVSGGHTCIAEVCDYDNLAVLASTVDDAAGEAFDKVARVLGLPYPGGPNVDRLAKQSDTAKSFYKVPKPVNKDFTISYSGLKTAVINHVHTAAQRGEGIDRAETAKMFTRDAFDNLIKFTVGSAKARGYKTVLTCGGVAANSYLRQHLTEAARKESIRTVFPSMQYCGDNAAMVAADAYFKIRKGRGLADLTLNAVSGLPLTKI